MKSDIIFDFAIIALPLAIIFARAYFVVFKWENYKDNIKSIFAINEGGLAIYGGIIGGILAALIFIAWRKVSLLTLTDLVIPSLVLGQAIGRWGNFVNQEAYGNLITDTKLQFFPYGVYIDTLKEWHQATFFYESMLCLAIFIVVLVMSHKKVKTGKLLATYMFLYGVGRFFIEGLRTDSLMVAGSETVRISQIVSIVLAVAGFVLFMFIERGVIQSKNSFGVYALAGGEPEEPEEEPEESQTVEMAPEEETAETEPEEENPPQSGEEEK